MSVYQDFEQGIYDALESGIELLEKYTSINIIFPEIINHPIDILVGTKNFYDEYKMDFQITDDVSNITLSKGIVYILTLEENLAFLVKLIRNSD